MNALNQEAWANWCQYRRTIKKPYKTEFAIERAQKKLASFGEWQMQVVEQSMEREWRGLFSLPKDVIARLEREKRDDKKRARELAELAERASRIGFRKPLHDEGPVEYRTLVERAEHQDWLRKANARVGVRSIADVIGGLKT